MAKSEKSEQIRSFILNKSDHYSGKISNVVRKKFGISRQNAHYHLSQLVKEGLLRKDGFGVGAKYRLVSYYGWEKQFAINESLDESDVWLALEPNLLLEGQKNILDVLHYGFTEMLNNAKDHSEGNNVKVRVCAYSSKVIINIADDGIGIFRKIQREEKLSDPRQAIIVLSKGKYTTDPENHSGQGIFFTSRAFDFFDIVSGDIAFISEKEGRDWMVDEAKFRLGTTVCMEIQLDNKMNLKDLFDSFSNTEDDYQFNKTIIPVRRLKAHNEGLVSRSQAKRLLAGLDQFESVWLDFKGIDKIGQGFADEIFRVWKGRNSKVAIHFDGANAEVSRMISKVIKDAATFGN